MATARTGGQLIVDALHAQGAEHVFCVPGESYLAVLDALHDAKINVTVCRQEGDVEAVFPGNVEHRLRRAFAALAGDVAEATADVRRRRAIAAAHDKPAEHGFSTVGAAVRDHRLADLGVLQRGATLVERLSQYPHPAGQAGQEEGGVQQGEADVDGPGLHLRPDTGAPGELLRHPIQDPGR